jgi:glycine/D-amino acid oxidase-like deaminating enzyme
MRIAILGAGLAGLATAWYLLHHSQGTVSIDIYDPLPIGEGASGISSGLLHPFAGKNAKRVKDAEQKLNTVNQLLGEAGRQLGRGVVLSKGILRPAVTPQQQEDFKKCADEHSETEWWSKEKCETSVPGIHLESPHAGGLFIKQGLTIDVPSYLEGLCKSIALFGTQFIPKAVTKEADLARYEKVIFAIGPMITHIKPLSHLPVEGIKGQVLTVKWPANLPSLPFSLISEGYIVMGKDLKTCFIGSTFERNFSSAAPDPDFAIQEIRRKIAPFFPAIAGCEVVACKAGVRAAGKNNHLPIMGQINERFWFLTGLGGKGLLYHAYLGEKLALALLQNDLSYLPKEFNYKV